MCSFSGRARLTVVTSGLRDRLSHELFIAVVGFAWLPCGETTGSVTLFMETAITTAWMGSSRDMKAR